MNIVNILIAIFLLIIIAYLVVQVLMKPVKLIWKLLINSLIGLILLLLVNYLALHFDFSIPINIISILIAGFLGIPGILLLIAFQLLII